MNAKEMFEKLGYAKLEDAMTISYHFGNLQVRFWKNTKHIELFGCSTPDMNIENEEYFEDDYKLFVAINKQVEELGWNEIKEILDYIGDRIIPNEKWNKIKDYITNLQEENNRLKESTNCKKCCFIKDNVNYIRRIDKALEFIDKYCIDDEFYINLTYKEKAIIEVKKILQGVDE